MTESERTPAIWAKNAAFAWPGSDFRLTVNELSIDRGARVLLMGPSGSGKSTLLSLICGVNVPQQGEIRVLSKDLAQMRSAERDRFRVEHFGIIFQMFNLLPYAGVLDNVILPLGFAPGRRARCLEDGPPSDEARRLLHRLGFADEIIAAKKAARLSVGQQQRVAVARALIGRPEFVVADEPTSALDRQNQDAFFDLLFEETAAVGSTLIVVSHDDRIESRFDGVIYLSDIIANSESAA